MDDDELRTMLRRIDPAPSDVSVTAADHPAARALLEGIMSTPVQTPTPEADLPTAMPIGRSRRMLAMVGFAAAAVVAAVVVGVVINRDDDEQPTTAISLSLPDATSLSSCLMFDVSFLAQMPNAFQGTVTEVTDTQVVLTVDRWFVSESEQTDAVALQVAPNNTSASLDGVTFTQGASYLVTATNGMVNGCGFSGPTNPELEAAFETAFGS